jgi:predicted acyltransferase
MVLIAIFGLSAVITALVSPQSVQLSPVADMRHMVPLIPLGSLFAALTLFILWQRARFIALTVAILLVFSNLLFLGHLDKNRGFGLAPRGVSSTLVDYISETFNDYETSTETIIRLLKDKPDGSVILVYPPYNVLFAKTSLRLSDRRPKGYPP